MIFPPWRIVDTSPSRIVARQHFFFRGGPQNRLESLYTNTSGTFTPRKPPATPLEKYFFLFRTPQNLPYGGVNTKKLYKSTIRVSRPIFPLSTHLDLILAEREGGNN